MSSVVVLDYGSGNLRSAQRALARAGARVEVTADADAALECDGLVVPGVGAFAACMAGLRAVGGDKLLARRLELGRPVLGICVGMQVLFAAGVEHGVWTDGCGAWPGTVERLDAGVLPHMGWNTVAAAPGSVLFAGIPAGTRFYFVHSYALCSPGAEHLAAAGAQVAVTADPDAALDCDGLVVPGVGAFAACMAGLRAVGGDKLIARRLELGRPVLGICVGMQVLFAAGVEHGMQSGGCAAFPGTVERLDAGVLPHMGWNTVTPPPGSALFAGIAPGTRFYFVHSYALGSPGAERLAAAGALISWAEHGEPFAAAVEQGMLAATQFHPEKSGDAGAALLANWLETL